MDEINSSEDLKFYLCTALFNQDTTSLKKLFSKFKSSKDEKFGDYINEICFGKFSPLAIALIKVEGLQDLSLLNLLLENGANPDIKDRQSDTPLIIASYRGYYETVEILLKYSASLSVQNKYGEVPLHKASSRGHYKIVELLLKRGAGKESECVNNALLAAVEYHEQGYKKEKTVELLLKYGANPNEKNYHMRLIERAPYSANSGIINCIKTTVLPYGSNDKVKKLMAEYGGVDRCYLRDQTILTCCCLIVASATLFSMASPWRYIPTTIFALAACFFVKNAVQAAFFAKIKEPSPEFAEVITEEVVGSNAKDNSQNVLA